MTKNNIKREAFLIDVSFAPDEFINVLFQHYESLESSSSLTKTPPQHWCIHLFRGF